MSEDLSVDYLDGLPPAKREELARANDPGLTALRQYLASGQAVAFLGAGVSAPLYPLWAGLIVLLNQKLNRRLGFANPLLYNIDQSRGFRDITMGNNGAYTAGPGWDPCTGLGSPDGSALLSALE